MVPAHITPDVLMLLQTHLFQGPSRLPQTVRWPAEVVTYHVKAPNLHDKRLTGFCDLVPGAVRTLNRKLKGKVRLDPVATEESADIRVIFGTAIVFGDNPNYQEFVASTSATPGNGDDIACDDQGRICKPVFVDIGHQHLGCRCKVVEETVIHEFSHALGIKRHFDGFGNWRGIICDASWDLLATIYSHPPGTAINEITKVVRAAP